MSPIRTYHNKFTPPRWWEKLYAHPFEVVLALQSALFGLRALIGRASESAPSASPAVATLSDWQTYTLGGSLLVGGLALVFALVGPMPDLEAEWLLERAGLSLLAISWASLTITTYHLSPHAVDTLVLTSGWALACLLRLIVTLIVQNALRRKDIVQ